SSPASGPKPLGPPEGRILAKGAGRTATGAGLAFRGFCAHQGLLPRLRSRQKPRNARPAPERRPTGTWASPPRVMPAVQLLHALPGHMRVNLRRRDVAMAEQE